MLEQFDQQLRENFRDMERPSKLPKITGSSTVYNFVEEACSFKAYNFELKGDEGFAESAKVCKIHSVNARDNQVEPAPIEVARGRGRGGRRSARH